MAGIDAMEYSRVFLFGIPTQHGSTPIILPEKIMRRGYNNSPKLPIREVFDVYTHSLAP